MCVSFGGDLTYKGQRGVTQFRLRKLGTWVRILASEYFWICKRSSFFSRLQVIQTYLLSISLYLNLCFLLVRGTNQPTTQQRLASGWNILCGPYQWKVSYCLFVGQSHHTVSQISELDFLADWKFLMAWAVVSQMMARLLKANVSVFTY